MTPKKKGKKFADLVRSAGPTTGSVLVVPGNEINFAIYGSALKKAELFSTKHKNGSGTICKWKHSLTYEFTPTGIGTAVSVSCNYCHQKLNVTDYDDW